jgi:hypothetical protein
MIQLTYRPIDTWPGEETPPGQRRRSQFSAPYGRTLELLERELEHLSARNVVLQVALEEKDIRLDGRPRARATARHPGVILAFDSKHGPLKYAVDRFWTWDDNIRAIALALEALRKVDRYGVVKRGEQYTGWRQLEAHTGVSSKDEARELLARIGGAHGETDHELVRSALMVAHPDRGGDAETFQQVQEARKVLGA